MPPWDIRATARRKWIVFVAVSILAIIAGLLLLPPGTRPPKPSGTIVATYPNRFEITLYYTPRESGFTANNGFNVTPETRSGLEGRNFPRDFLLAVEKEGFGRMTNPHRNMNYIFHRGGRWGYGDKPVDKSQQPLLPKQSCAVSPAQKALGKESSLSVDVRGLPEEFSSIRWRPSDVGSAVGKWQVDLYWGEDDPRGPDKEMALPKTAPLVEGNATVTVWK